MGLVQRSFVHRARAGGVVAILIALTLSAVARTPLSPIRPAAAATTDVAASSGAFPDVPENSWAYSAVQQLAGEGYIKGYLDGQYKGNRPMTRYEVAVLVARADTAIRDALAGGGEVKPADIVALRKLLTEFASEIKDIQSRVSALEAKTAGLQKTESALKQEADASALAINRAHFADNIIFRPGSTTTEFNVLNGPTTVAGNAPHTFLRANGSTAASRGTAYSYGAGAINTTPVGTYGQGSLYWFNRIALLGTLAKGWSYGLRLSTGGIHQDAPNGTSTASGFCTGVTGVPSVNCSYDNLNTSTVIPIVLEYGYTQWTSPGGAYAVAGRFTPGESSYIFNPNNAFFAGQSITGAQIGYRSSDRNFQGQILYGISGVTSNTLASVNASAAICATGVAGLDRGLNNSYTNFNPNCNSTTSEIGSTFSFRLPDKRTIFLVGEDYFAQKVVPLWDPAAVSCRIGAAVVAAADPQRCRLNAGTVTTPVGGSGNYFTGQANIGATEVTLAHYLGNSAKPQFQVAGTWINRLGSDPFTGSEWTGHSAYIAAATFASKGNLSTGSANPFNPGTGAANSNVLQFSWSRFGANSFFGVDAGPTSGTPTPTNNTSLLSFNGMDVYVFQYSHWFNDNVRLGLIGIHVQNIPGTILPIGAAGVGTVSPCPGCSGYINLNQLDVETYISM